MVRKIQDLLDAYNELGRIITEYDTSYQFCMTHTKSRSEEDRIVLLGKLQAIEAAEREQRLRLQQNVQQQIQDLRLLLQVVDFQERRISEYGFRRFRTERANEPRVPMTREVEHSRREISRQVEDTVKSIQRVTNSKMPRSVAAICSFFNPNFRRNAYRQIVEDRKHLEDMLNAAEMDLRVASATLSLEIQQAASQQVNALQSERLQLESNRNAERSTFLTQLKSLLLDGMERVFVESKVYSTAYSDLTNYLKAYLDDDESSLSQANSLLLGIVNQVATASDDGVLDTYLTAVLPDGVYSNGSILLPVALEPYMERPLCVNYYSEYNQEVYTLFSNYALQLMNCFSDIGVTTYLVDCTNMGSRYAGFTAAEGSVESKRVNIIRTADILKKVLNELSDYIIETNSSYLRSDFPDVRAYNESSAMKRELKILFISSISEITSMEVIEKLTSIVRNGNRCGVIPFLSISSDECQVNGITSHHRVTAINQLLELCDKIWLGSSGELSFGNGLPQLSAAPAISDSKCQLILRNTVEFDGSLSEIPVADHLPQRDTWFSYDCEKQLNIPIGVDTQGNEYCIDLNAEAAYMLIGGNPHCGKSSLIHSIILQCITRFGPNNLELYLADLKEGAEFDIYSNMGIRSVKAVLNDDEADIATSFLNYIQALINERLHCFEELRERSGQLIRNIEEFYSVNKDECFVPKIPRTLLIIDEFQSLYDSARATGAITNTLVRMGRTVGIYIIMASQRALPEASNTSNSFSNDTKEYFIYRVAFKMPYSAARQILSEHCSDTNRENPAVRRTQTLRKGQIIINPNMGATEEDNRLVHCYFAKNETISDVCAQVIEAQGRKNAIILNSESKPILPREDEIVEGILLGESNRLYNDRCNRNNDLFIDDRVVALRPAVRRLLVCGSDARVHAGILLAIFAHMTQSDSRAQVCVLSSSIAFDRLGLSDSLSSVLHRTASVEEFLTFAHSRKDSIPLLAVIVDPYSIEGLQKDTYASPSETVQNFTSIFLSNSCFTLVLCENIRKLRDNCSYLEQEFPCRIISAGNVESIRAAMTMDAGDKISNTQFNIVRPNVIKAYYYNKTTDKLGRFRLYEQEQLLNRINLHPNSDPASIEEGYSGLMGN